jgi:hypothetical protein
MLSPPRAYGCLATRVLVLCLTRTHAQQRLLLPRPMGLLARRQSACTRPEQKALALQNQLLVRPRAHSHSRATRAVQQVPVRIMRSTRRQTARQLQLLGPKVKLPQTTASSSPVALARTRRQKSVRWWTVRQATSTDSVRLAAQWLDRARLRLVHRQLQIVTAWQATQPPVHVQTTQRLRRRSVKRFQLHGLLPMCLVTRQLPRQRVHLAVCSREPRRAPPIKWRVRRHTILGHPRHRAPVLWLIKCSAQTPWSTDTASCLVGRLARPLNACLLRSTRSVATCH